MRAFRTRHGLTVGALFVTACGLTAASCGGSPATIPGEGGTESGGGDAGTDHKAPNDAHIDAPKHHDAGHHDAGHHEDASSDSSSDAPSDSPVLDSSGDAPGDVSADAPVSCVTNSTPCATPPGGECCGNICVPGNCCVDPDCTTGSAISCQANACTACDAVASNAYFVDPVNGSDGTNTTGSNSAGGATAGICAFKTIGHALSVIGSSPPSGTTITVLSDDSHAINGEQFPLVVPVNTIIQGASASVKISVSGTTTDGGPVGSDGFDLAATASGLSTLTLDGTGATTGSRGVVVGAGSTSSTTVSNVTVNGFPAEGIVVNSTGVLTVSPGTVSTHNLDGLHVTDTASATVTGSSSLQTAFNSNGIGILVDAAGSVSIVGTPGTAGAGTVVANSNGSTGQDAVVFKPKPSGTGTFPTMSLVNGLVIYGSSNNGLHAFGGANVKVRNSYILNNGLTGIRVDANVACTGVPIACTDNNYSMVDLGNSAGADWGLNTVQDVSSGSPNKAAGICFAPNPPAVLSSLTLLADGNIFGTINCSTTAGALTQASDCTSTTSLDVGLPSTTSISIATNMCTN